MPCPSVITGSQFLERTLSHLDCQAQTLGSFGFQSLAAPGSPAATALTALLTLFVALLGIRLLFGPAPDVRDVVTPVLKIGIVLTIAVSWPAWRMMAYDTVLLAPAEIGAAIMPSTLPDARTGFAERLQGIDTGIAALTIAGTGRQTGAVLDEGLASGFRQVALEDETGFGWARTFYLASTIGSLAVLRVSGGLLLALAPLLAGLLLFDMTRGLFAGWLRSLALVALGSVGLTVLLSVQVALMEPWLADVLNRRTLGYATPTAPTELLALVIGFALATAGLLFILGRMVFHSSWSLSLPAIRREATGTTAPASRAPTDISAGMPYSSRAAQLSQSVAHLVRREDNPGFERVRMIGIDRTGTSSPSIAGEVIAPAAPLGSGYRRAGTRTARSKISRDERG